MALGITSAATRVARTDPWRVASVTVNDGSAQQSMVNSLTMTFDQLVTIDSEAFELQRQGGNFVELKVATSIANNRIMAQLAFARSEIVGGSLADGDPRAATARLHEYLSVAPAEPAAGTRPGPQVGLSRFTVSPVPPAG